MQPSSSGSDKSDVASELRHQSGVITEKWIQEVRRRIPASAHQGDGVLSDMFPLFLDGLAQLLSAPVPPSVETSLFKKNERICKVHGIQRSLIPEYSLDDVIFEYRILRQILFDVLETHGSLGRKERNILLRVIDEGMIAAATEFGMKLRVEQSSSEKDAIGEAKEAHIRLTESNLQIEMLKSERTLRESFVCNLSHDLLGPLSTARMHAELIMSQLSLDPKIYGRSGSIMRGIDRVSRMVKDLLDANRIRAGEGLHLECFECDLVQIGSHVVEDLTLTHGNRFVLESKNGIHGFWSSDALTRVIENLLTNAIKYGSPQKFVTLKFKTFGERVQISVHNEGNPLSVEEQDTLFRRFRRGSAAQNSANHGWGLGLTLVQGITNALGGEIKIESTTDLGTVVTVDLPMDSRSFQSALSRTQAG